MKIDIEFFLKMVSDYHDAEVSHEIKCYEDIFDCSQDVVNKNVRIF